MVVRILTPGPVQASSPYTTPTLPSVHITTSARWTIRQPLVGSPEPILVAAGDDVVGPARRRPPHVLRLQVAAVGGVVAVDLDLVVAHEVLARVEVLQRGADTGADGVDADERRRAREIARGIGHEDVVEQRPVLGVERPGVPGDDLEDLALVEQGLQIGGGRAHTSVHPPSTTRLWPVT